MMRCAVVENGVVVNVIIAEAADPELDWIEIPEGEPVDIGWTYVDGVFINPNPIPDDGLGRLPKEPTT